MPVVGMSINSLTAQKKQKPKGEVTVTSKPEITSVKEMKLEVLSTPTLEIGFEFKIDYKPNLGKMEMKGTVMYTTPDAKEVAKKWKKEKKLPTDIDVEIRNYLLRKCLVIAIDLAEKMQMPLPVWIPAFKKKK